MDPSLPTPRWGPCIVPYLLLWITYRFLCPGCATICVHLVNFWPLVIDGAWMSSFCPPMALVLLSVADLPHCTVWSIFVFTYYELQELELMPVHLCAQIPYQVSTITCCMKHFCSHFPLRKNPLVINHAPPRVMAIFFSQFLFPCLPFIYNGIFFLCMCQCHWLRSGWVAATLDLVFCIP